MTVADLQQALQHLGRVLETIGAGKAATAELAVFVAGLDRFRDRPLKDFAGLLGRLDESGQVAPKARAPRAPAAPKPPSLAAQAAATEVRRLYVAAATTTTVDEVAALYEALGKLTGPELKHVASAVEYTVPARQQVGKTRDAIRDRITSRMGSTVRRQLLDRPAPAPDGPDSS